jgi:hypothetical protein
VNEWKPPATWMIVRRSRTIPGGYRIVRSRLSEKQAREWAPKYARPHEAMATAEVMKRRMIALGTWTDEMESP